MITGDEWRSGVTVGAIWRSGVTIGAIWCSGVTIGAIWRSGVTIGARWRIAIAFAFAFAFILFGWHGDRVRGRGGGQIRILGVILVKVLRIYWLRVCFDLLFVERVSEEVLTSARVGFGTSALHTKKLCSWQKKQE